MFVKNLTKSTLEFKKNGRVLKLQPGVNLVDSLNWRAEDLRKTYGPTMLIIIGEELPEVAQPEEVPVEKVEEEHDVLKDEGEQAGEADQADNNPQLDNAPVKEEAEADKKEEDGDAVKTETEPKAPAKAKAKTTAKKTTGKKNK